MSTATLTVPDISCGHCEATITKALGSQPGVSSVRVVIPDKRVVLDYDPTTISLKRIKEILAEEDYPVEATTEG